MNTPEGMLLLSFLQKESVQPIWLVAGCDAPVISKRFSAVLSAAWVEQREIRNLCPLLESILGSGGVNELPGGTQQIL